MINKTIRNVSFVVWLICISIFVYAQYNAPPNYSSTSIWSSIFGFSVALGFLSFAVFLFSALSSHFEVPTKNDLLRLKKHKKNYLPYFLLTLVLLLVYLSYKNIYLKNDFISNSLKSQNNSNQVTPPQINATELFKMVNDYRESMKLARVEMDSETCQITDRVINNDWWSNKYNLSEYSDICPNCSSLSVSLAQDIYSSQSVLDLWKNDSKTKSNITSNSKYGCLKVVNNKIALIFTNKKSRNTAPINTDPVVSCTSTASNCNGSSIKLPQSQCSKITCCQVGNTWSVYPSSEKCTEAQNAGQQTTPNSIKSVTNSFYCWNNAYGYAYYTTSGDQCNIDNLKWSTYKMCKDTQKSKVDLCNSKCKSDSNDNDAICAWAYLGDNAGIENNVTKYGECLNGSGGSGEIYGICLQKCSDQYAEDLKTCHF